MFGVGLQKSGEKIPRRNFDASRRRMESLSVLQRVTWILAAITRPMELHPGGLCLKAGFPTSKIEKKCSKTPKCPKSLGPNGKF